MPVLEPYAASSGAGTARLTKVLSGQFFRLHVAVRNVGLVSACQLMVSAAAATPGWILSLCPAASQGSEARQVGPSLTSFALDCAPLEVGAGCECNLIACLLPDPMVECAGTPRQPDQHLVSIIVSVGASSAEGDTTKRSLGRACLPLTCKPSVQTCWHQSGLGAGAAVTIANGCDGTDAPVLVSQSAFVSSDPRPLEELGWRSMDHSADSTRGAVLVPPGAEWIELLNPSSPSPLGEMADAAAWHHTAMRAAAVSLFSAVSFHRLAAESEADQNASVAPRSLQSIRRAKASAVEEGAAAASLSSAGNSSRQNRIEPW